MRGLLDDLTAAAPPLPTTPDDLAAALPWVPHIITYNGALGFDRFTFEDFAPALFQDIRALCKIPDDEYKRSMSERALSGAACRRKAMASGSSESARLASKRTHA